MSLVTPMRPIVLFFTLAATAVYAAVGDAWVGKNASPTSAALRGIAWTGSKFIAGGKDGAALSSSDGVTWTPGITGTQADLNAAASSGSVSMLAGDDGVILTSSDSTTWTAQRGPALATWRGATWTGSKFVLVGDGGAVATSSNGTTWAFRYVGAMTDLLSVASAGSLMVAGGTNGIISTSTDGVTWNSGTQGTSASVKSVATSGSLWVASLDNGSVLTSSNGTSWTLVATGVSVSLNSVIWAGSQFIATGVDGACVTSANGSSWTVRSMGSTGEFLAGAFGAGTAVFVGENGIVSSSSNGTSWALRSSGVVEDLHEVIKTGTGWAAVGDVGSITLSTTGTGWTNANSTVTANLRSIAWNGSKLVAVGDSGTIISSNDGNAWSASSSGTTRTLVAVAASLSQWVAVGEGGVMLTSSNGTSWSSAGSVTSSTLRGVTWSGTQFVAVGDGGVIATSSTGTSWTSRSSGVSISLESVAWSGSLFVAVGANGTVLTSTSGSGWSKVILPITDTTFSQFESVKWDGVEFVAVGESGSPMNPKAWVMTSYDGATWVLRSIEGAPPLASVAAANGQVMAAGLGGAILQNVAAAMPELAFEVASSSFAESAGVVTVKLTLSSPALVPILAAFNIVGSTAVLGTTGDAIVPTSPVTIPPNQTSALMNITIREDNFDEGDETVVLNLLTPTGATLGFPRVHTLTITDNDTRPSIVSSPVSQIVSAGTFLTMDATATGDLPLTYQWKKNGVSISGAIASTYLIAGAPVSGGGTYQLTVTNKSGTALSEPAELVVVDAANKTLPIVQKQTATFIVAASGHNLTYQWKKDGQLLADDLTTAKRISGVTTPSLVVKNLSPADSGVYRCTVSSPVGDRDGGSNTLTVLIPPIVNPPLFPTLMISETMNFQVTAQNNPSRFSIAGLPSGLTYNSSTGVVSGKPLVASGVEPFTITVTASNAAGSSYPPTTMPLVVQPLTVGIAGSYLGLIDHDPNVNGNLGGKLTLTVSKTGVATGSVLMGKSASSFVKAVDTAPATIPTLTQAIKRTNLSNLNVTISSLDPATGIVSGTMQDSNGTVLFSAWRNKEAPFTGYPANYTSALELAEPLDLHVESIPQGYGYSNFAVSSTGNASGAMRLADGTQFTFSAPLRNINTVVLYATFYGLPGSLMGSLNITPGSPAVVSSIGLYWRKPKQTSGRSYIDGFDPLPLTAFGAAYSPPPTKTALALGLSNTLDDVPNASLVFEDGGAPDPGNRLNAKFRFTAPNIRDPQTPAVNNGKVTISINHLTGVITGGFSLMDTDTTVNKPLVRNGLYYGLIVRHPADGVLRGYGNFQLPMMPQNAVHPVTTSSTSPILSGKVTLNHYSP